MVLKIIIACVVSIAIFSLGYEAGARIRKRDVEKIKKQIENLHKLGD